MITFKCIADVDRCRNHPLHDTIKSLVSTIIADCSKHRHRLNNTGSVHERSLKYKTYWREVEEVRALFDENPNHGATEAAVKWIAKWMEQAVYAPERRENGYVNRIPARTFVRRLADLQVDPQETPLRNCVLIAGIFSYQ